MVKLLLSAGADVNSIYQDTTPLHTAVLNTNNLDMIFLLLEYGADKNLRDYDDFTPAELAMRFDEQETANLINNYYLEDIKDPGTDYDE